MTKLHILIVLGAIAILFGCSKERQPKSASTSLGAESTQSQSSLEFDFHELQLGVVREGRVVEMEFPFVVKGPDPIFFTRISTSCGCTNARIQPDWDSTATTTAWPLNSAIPAGAKGRVIAEFNSGSHEAEKLSTIKLTGNFISGSICLQINATVSPTFELSPTEIFFGEVSTREVKKEISVSAQEPFSILRWISPLPGVHVEEIGAPVIGPKGLMLRKFSVVAAPNLPEKRLTSILEAETSLGQSFKIRLNGASVGPVKYSPMMRVDFGIYAEGEGQMRVVTAEPVQLGLPEPTLELAGNAADIMRVFLRPRDLAGPYEMEVSIDEEAPAGNYSGFLFISFPKDSGIPRKKLVLSAHIR
jgi:hypothetical protein